MVLAVGIEKFLCRASGPKQLHGHGFAHLRCLPSPNHCRAAGNSPLYFQHEGHSRTIIGIERYRQKDASEHVYNLLVLDPSIKSEIIEAKLKQGKGWQVQPSRRLNIVFKPCHTIDTAHCRFDSIVIS